MPTLVIHIEIPPAKRRRTLAGSIVSSAFNAALIGTAVGLTVYRFWRNRGKESDQQAQSQSPPPPPPYQQGEWTPVHVEQVQPPAPVLPHRRPRPAPTSSTTRPRRIPRRPRPSATSSQWASRPFVDDNEPSGSGSVVEDQMDWIGDRLGALIEEGKKALGTEVVVGCENGADEIDDGSPAWVEDDGNLSTKRSSRARKDVTPPRSFASPSKRPKPGYGSPPSLRTLPAWSTPPLAPIPAPSPTSSSMLGLGMGLTSPGNPSGSLSKRRGLATPTSPTIGRMSNFGEQEEEEEAVSPEVREYMEKARARWRERVG